MRRVSMTEAYDNRSVIVQLHRKQDRLTAGANITIEGDVISAYPTSGRDILIGRFQTPPDSLGKDGDLYIYNPNGE